jgi:hypothetical protein
MRYPITGVAGLFGVPTGTSPWPRGAARPYVVRVNVEGPQRPRRRVAQPGAHVVYTSTLAVATEVSAR